MLTCLILQVANTKCVVMETIIEIKEVWKAIIGVLRKPCIKYKTYNINVCLEEFILINKLLIIKL